MNNPLQEVWDHCAGKPTLEDRTTIERGQLKEKDRPVGECRACGRFAKGAMIHESPGTAKCCIGCDAYKGL